MQGTELMSFPQFIEWAFLAILTGGVVWSAKFLSDISQSVQQLNEKIATILERVDWHEKEITDLSGRIRELERIDSGHSAGYDS